MTTVLRVAMDNQGFHSRFEHASLQHDAAFARQALHSDIGADPEDAPFEAAAGVTSPHAIDLPRRNLVVHAGVGAAASSSRSCLAAWPAASAKSGPSLAYMIEREAFTTISPGR